MRTALTVAVLTASLAPARAAEPRATVGQEVLLGGRVAPLGLTLESETTLRWRFGPDGDLLFEDNHVEVGALVGVTPVEGLAGAVVELQPAAFLVLRARALALGWFGTFGTLATFEGLDADWSPDRLAALEDADQGSAAGGWQIDVEAQLRLAIEGFIALAGFRPTWIHADVEGPYYEPYNDLLLAPDDLLLIGNALAGWRFDNGSVLALRWDGLVGDAAGQPRHTLGALVHWVAMPADGAAPEVAVDALVGLYAEDRYRAGDAFAAVGLTLAWRLAR